MKRPKLKKASKRMTCHKRFKIQKKVREHNRKARKAAKKRGHKKPKKDLGVPNAAPFKEEVLREAEQRKQMREELKQKQKLDRQKEFQKKREQEANKKNANKIEDHEKEPEPLHLCQFITWYNILVSQNVSISPVPFQVIDASDVVLEVLDARDPLGCRCPQLEQLVCQSDGGKKLLLVLNKIDLIPKENLEKWLNYLNNELPTIAFKSATHLRDRKMQQQKYIKRRSASISFSRANLCFGRDCLLKHLQDHSVTKGKVIQVGVVGNAKVRYYSQPPESWNLSPHLSMEAVAAIQQDFDMEDLAEDNKSTIKGESQPLNIRCIFEKGSIKYPNQASSIFFQSPGFTDGVIEDSELSEEILGQESMEASEDEEELTEDEGDEDEESDVDNAEEESSKPMSNPTTPEVLETKNADWGKSLTDKEINIDMTGDMDDAYDFNTDYI
ncbi:hypothetical protein lerEdw1_016045 [Lerista edwardsae]|nr:hypothetical protein lerEdw1_016045 [Lerista edwardsae]